MLEVFKNLVGITGWFADFVRELDCGVAMGRGHQPVVESSQKVRLTSRVQRSAVCRRWVARRETRAWRGGK